MKIKISEFYENIGTVFRNPKDIMMETQGLTPEDKDEYVLLPKGTYLIVDSEEYGFDIYDIKKNKNVFFETTLLDEDMEFDIFYTDPKEIIDLMIESITKKVIQLTAEGWTIDPENEYFDLSPYINKLTTLKTLRDIMNVGNKNSQ